VRIRLSFHSASSKLMLCTLSAIGHVHDSCSMSRRHLDDVSSSNHIPHPSQRKSALLSCLSLHFRQRQPAILGMSSLSISTGYFPHTRIPLLISCPFPRLFSLSLSLFHHFPKRRVSLLLFAVTPLKVCSHLNMDLVNQAGGTCTRISSLDLPAC
jgi:hypothetical protein